MSIIMPHNFLIAAYNTDMVWPLISQSTPCVTPPSHVQTFISVIIHQCRKICRLSVWVKHFWWQSMSLTLTIAYSCSTTNILIKFTYFQVPSARHEQHSKHCDQATSQTTKEMGFDSCEGHTFYSPSWCPHQSCFQKNKVARSYSWPLTSTRY
jgi:hypothetical protein